MRPFLLKWWAEAKGLAGLLLKWLVVAAKGLAGPLLKAWARLSAALGGLTHSDNLVYFATWLAQRFVSKDPEVQKATNEMSGLLGDALSTDYLVVIWVVISCIMLLGAFIGCPLIYKWLSKRRLGIFISFNHTKEDISENLQKRLEEEGVRTIRIPFQEGATHQSIVIQTVEGLRTCDGVVCLPGYTQSFLGDEVLAATTSRKPIVFLVSETSGTLPNTADKRYPMFRLETTIREGFKPLIDFISYVGADFKSTTKLCWRALLHPFMHMSLRVVLGLGLICLMSLWAYCSFSVTSSSHNVTKGVAVSAEVERAVVLAHVVILTFAMSIAFLCFSYVSLFLVNQVRQFQARRRARLKTVAAEFNRDDWIGIVPGLSPGGHMYQCLFETAPSAHHEGDLAGALNSLGIMEKLAKQDPGNAGWQGELAWAYWRTGSVWAEVESKSKDEARVLVEKGRDILRQLKERAGLTANQQEWLDSIEADLRKLQEKE
jgi:hypothetical protein